MCGVFALYFLKALGVQFGPQEQLIEQKYLDICRELLKRAKDNNVKVILPTDFITLNKPKVGQEKEGEHEETKEGIHSQEHTQRVGSTLGVVGEVNWIDLIYDDGLQTVDFTNYINMKLEQLPNLTTNQPASVSQNDGEQPATGENEENKDEEQPEAAYEPSHELSSNAYVVEFGPQTVQNVLSHTKDAMKIFWDGSISLYPDTLANENNKAFTLDLLRIRGENEDRAEPKYSLIHSEETAVVVHQAQTKIKLDQMDNKDAEGSMGDAYNESGSMTSTFQQDNISPAIFVCAEGRFTLQILQGIENKCLMNMDEHPALTQEQIEDDLAILDEI